MMLPTLMRGFRLLDRVLEDDLHLPAQPAQRFAAIGEKILAVVPHAAGGRRDQPQDRPPHRGLAAAGFPHQSQRFARLDVEADAVDGFDLSDRPRKHAASDREIRPQIAGLAEAGSSLDQSSSAPPRWTESPSMSAE